MKKCIIFGAAGNGERLFEKVSKRYEVIAYTDNNPEKWGGCCNGIKIINPKDIRYMDYDMVVIASMPGLKSIKDQLIKIGLEESLIDDSFVFGPIESRRVFLRDFSSFEFCNDAQVAEAGVFEGDFAGIINHYFPKRRLHLFDTFQGVDFRDVSKEGPLSHVKVGDYNNTSVELVMSRMEYPENVTIHKGFFPETAENVKGPFCFVNLDMDLYEPTLKGLEFFSNKMVPNGGILVHDYFSVDFLGPSKAVDRFLAENSKYAKYPIGDGISILIVGF